MTPNEVAAEARRLPPEPTAPWIRVLIAVVTVVWLAVLAWQATELPDRVPTQFGPEGEARGWSSKTGAMAFSALLPLVTAYPLPLLSRLSLRWPQSINAPNRDWWIVTAPRLRRFERLLREDLWLVAALMVGLFSAIQVLFVTAARSPDASLETGLIFSPIVAFLVLTLAVVGRMFGSRYAEQDVP